jgi:pimeloyl-ACP methyl ester carboxylesterase
MRRALSIVLCCVFVVAACSDDEGGGVGVTGAEATTVTTVDTTLATQPDDTIDPADLSTIEWVPCTDDAVMDDALECATLAVPLDHAAPDGESIDLALIRAPATDDRVGAVLLNPGGPGASGFDFAANAASTLQSEMGLEAFDLVGFDPRGVDRSNGLRCLTDAEIDATVYLDSSPDTPEERAALDAADGQFEEACLAKYGDTLRLYSTENTARDMDEIRVAMDDETISYLGISYGTYLGAAYATLFPERVRALVLDAAYEPTGDSIVDQYTTQAKGFEDAFDSWAEWCQASPDCGFNSADVGSDFDALRQQLDDSPAPTADGRSANEQVMGVATIQTLYSESLWPVLGNALRDARDGRGDELLSLADQYMEREADGSYSTSSQSQGIIDCASGLDPAVPDDPEAVIASLQEVAPRFSEGVTVDDFEDSCALLMPSVEPLALAYSGDAPVVVVGGLNDPAAPVRWAEEMTAVMGSTARLVTYTGEGHGFVLTSTCVTDIEAAVLRDLELPAEGTSCDPDPDIPRPAWWDDLPVPAGVDDVITSPEVTLALGITSTLAYSEIRQSALDPDAIFDAYGAVLEAEGFTELGRPSPFEGGQQVVYSAPDGQLFSILAITTDAYDDPELGNLGEVVPDPSKLLLVLLNLPA